MIVLLLFDLDRPGSYDWIVFIQRSNQFHLSHQGRSCVINHQFSFEDLQYLRCLVLGHHLISSLCCLYQYLNLVLSFIYSPLTFVSQQVLIEVFIFHLIWWCIALVFSHILLDLKHILLLYLLFLLIHLFLAISGPLTIYILLSLQVGVVW